MSSTASPRQAIRTPFPRLFAESPRRRRLLWLLALGTLVFGLAALPSLGTMSDNGVGILELEFVGSSGKAEDYRAELGSDGRSAARTSLLIDYPYLVCYGLFLAGVCVVVAARARRIGRHLVGRAGELLAWAGLGAALMDAIENGALLFVLGGETGQPIPAIATGCAAVKFALAAPASLFALVGWLVTRRGA